MAHAERPRRIRVSLGWPVLFLLVLAAPAGRLIDVLLLLALVCSHEGAHLAVAAGLGCRVTELRLMPLGGALTLGPEAEVVPRTEIAVALAGPLHHLVLLAAARLAGPFPQALGSHWLFFLQANLSLALFNLLPVYPLDGGRILRAMLVPARGFAEATRLARRLGRALAAGLLLAGIFAIFRGQGPLLGLAGCYLLIHAPESDGAFLPRYLRLQLRKRERLRRRKIGAVHWAVVTGETGILAGLSRTADRRYVMFCVLDQDGVPRAIVSEEDALGALARLGPRATFGMLAGGNGSVLSKGFLSRAGTAGAADPDTRRAGGGD